MATLEKIRSKGVFLLVVIGLALIAFIVGDLLNSSSTYVQQSRANIAEIDEEKVNIEDFQAAVNQFTEVYKIEYRTQTIDETLTERIRETVWENILKNSLIKNDADKIGMVVSEEELTDLTIGDYIHPLISGRPIFTNENGLFDRNILIATIAQLENKPTDPQMLEQYNALFNYWSYFENEVKNSRLEEKYTTLLSKAINTTSSETKFAYELKNKTSDVIYVSKKYHELDDKNFEPTEEEIQKVYEENKERFYQNSETRDLKYVAFNLNPSEQDFTDAKNWIENLKEEFATTTEIAAVVNSNSKSYRDVALSANEIDPDLKDFAFSASKDAVFEPQLFGNTFKMARVVETGILEPDSIKLRHIVIYEDTEEATQKLADSLFNAIQNGSDFAALAQQFSQMPQSAQVGGEIGWVKVSGLDKNIKNACFSNLNGNFFTVKDGNAIQIMQVSEKTKNVNKVKLAVISSEVTPSRATYGTIYNEAKAFAASANNIEQFEAIAKEKGYTVFPYPSVDANSPRLGMMNNSREIIRWAFENEPNAISDVYDCQNQFVVAALVSITEKGYRPVESVSNEVTNLARKNKKAEQLIADMTTSNIHELATKMNLQIDTVSQVNFASSSFGKEGNENAVIGSIAIGEKDKISAPIKGNNGVYVYAIVNQLSNTSPYNEEVEKQSLELRSKYAVYRAVEALKDKAEIEDNRSRFY